LTQKELDDLEAKAQAAAQGHLEFDSRGKGDWYERIYISSKCDGDYICAARPALILELIDAVREHQQWKRDQSVGDISQSEQVAGPRLATTAGAQRP
jgi:hypothetical protein